MAPKKNNRRNKLAVSLRYLNSKIRSSLKNLGYLPRWVIFILDLITVAFSGALTYILFLGIGTNYLTFENKYLEIAVYFFVVICCFVYFKTYAGIIRHSSIVDAIKIFFSQVSILFSVVVIDLISKIFFDVDFFLTTGLVVHAVISFCFLLLYRILVKQIFEVYFKHITSGNLQKVLIYGTDANAIAVANALLAEMPKRFEVVGFVNRYVIGDSKRILGLPIFGLKKRLQVLFHKYDVDALVIADKSLSKEEQLQLVDESLELEIKVYTVPLISDWENQKEISSKLKSFQIEDLLDRNPIVLNNDSISKTHSDKVVLITGAAGSIGSEIVRQVLDFEPKMLVLIDQAETPLHNLVLEIEKKAATTVVVAKIADIRDYSRIEKIFKKYHPEIVYHAAAYKHVPLMEENPSQAVLVNVLGTKHIADLAVSFGVERFVMVSTDKAVNPSNVMGASKRIAEMYVQSLFFEEKKKYQDTTKFITTRFGNVLGSNGSVVPLFTKQIAEGGPITITHKDIIRYFMTIPEACQLVLEAGTMGSGGEIYIFDMGKPVKIFDLAKKMIRLAGLIPDVDIKIKEIGLRPGEKLYEELLKDDSKTLPTHHEKIMVAQEIIIENELVTTQINQLTAIAFNGDSYEIVAKMKALVPEFISMNSTFENLDKK